ncbi:MAG TPA: hypothetical protein DIC34_06085 [Treponema sp.]|nr:hypothetical protein [Treponema sp.]
MTDRLPEAERANLVALLRGLSPRNLSIERPALPAALAGLVGRDPPRLPRALLFDVYGTLIASGAGGEPLAMSGPLTPEGGRARVLLETGLSEAGFPEGAEAFSAAVAAAIESANAEARKTRPFPEVDIRRILAGLLTDADDPLLRHLAILLECWRNPCAPMPGAGGLLSALAEAGIPHGLVSNAQFYTPLLLEALFGPASGQASGATAGATPGATDGLAGQAGISAELSLFSYRLGFAKPDTAIFERAADLLAEAGIESRDALMVGNSAANDVAPAKARGFMTALLARDARSFKPPEWSEAVGPEAAGSEATPDIVLTDLTDIALIAGIAGAGRY